MSALERAAWKVMTSGLFPVWNEYCRACDDWRSTPSAARGAGDRYERWRADALTRYHSAIEAHARVAAERWKLLDLATYWCTLAGENGFWLAPELADAAKHAGITPDVWF